MGGDWLTFVPCLHWISVGKENPDRQHRLELGSEVKVRALCAGLFARLGGFQHVHFDA